MENLSDAELRDFVHAYCNNHIYTSSDLIFENDPKLIVQVFIPLLFAAKDGQLKELLKDVAIIYGDMREEKPLASINGYPVFMSCKFMGESDWKRARAAIVKELERRKNIEV